MKKTLLYTCTGILPPAMTLLLLPVYLHFLSTTDYVILALTNSFVAVFSIFFNLKTDQAYRTLYFHEKENPAKQTQLFQTLFTFHGFALVFWLGLFYLLGPWVFQWVFQNNLTFFPFAWIILATFLVSNLCNLYYIHLQNTGKAKAYSIYLVTATLAVHALQLLVIFIFKLNFLWFLISGLCVNVIVLVVMFSSNRKLFSFSFSKTLFVEALRFSLPFIPFLLLYGFESQLDRFVMERYLSVDELAGYAVLISIITALLTFFNSIDNALRPELYQDLSRQNATATQSIREKFDWYWCIGLLVFSFLLAFGIHINWFLHHEKYNSIKEYFPWITLAFLPVIGIRFWALQLVYYKQVGKINSFLVAKIILLFVVFMTLIPKYKIYGAIVTIGLSHVLNAFVFYKLTPLKVVPSPRVVLYIILFVGMNSVIVLVKHINFLSLIAVSQFLLVVGFVFAHYRNRFKNKVQS